MKYTVSVAVDSRIDIEVEAADPEDAKRKAAVEFMSADLSEMETIHWQAMSAEDENGKTTYY